MALTRSDKFIIAGAITLALAVVLGLAIWKKPYLFTGGAPSAEAPAANQAAPAAPATTATLVTEESAPPAEAQAVQQAVSAPKQDAGAQPAAPAIPEPPAATTAGSAAMSVAPAEPPAAMPERAGAQNAETETPEGRILSKGDETLDDMFSEMAKPEPPAPGAEAPQPKDKPAKPQAAAGQGLPDESASQPPSVEPQRPATAQAPQPGPAAAEKPKKPAKDDAPAIAKADSMDAPKQKAPAKKPAPAVAPVRGRILSVSAVAGPGEFSIALKASAAIPGYQKFFLDNPPRVVVDLDGAWGYSGPWTLPGRGPLVLSVRLGKHPGKFRIVVDLAPDAETRLRAAPEISRVPDGIALKIR